MSTANPNRTRVPDDPNWPMVAKYRKLLDDVLSAQEPSGVQEPTYALTGLSAHHVEALRDILSRTRPASSAEVEVITFTRNALDKINTHCCDHPQCGRYGYCPMDM